MINDFYPCVFGIEFRDIEGYPGYCVGTDGSVWSRKKAGDKLGLLHEKWTRLKGIEDERKYLRVSLFNGCTYTRLYIHSIVLTAFVGDRPMGMEACHFPDRNRQNNALSNLRWGTRKENMLDAAIHGTHAKGETNGQSKLKEEEVAKIRKRHGNGEAMATLAREFNTSYGNVWCIVYRKSWKHVS